MNQARIFPERVVRFYSNVDFALDAIGTQQITLIHASKLNDPFDPYLFFETDFAEKYESLVDYVSANFPDDVGWFMREFPIEGWKKSLGRIEEYFCRLKDNVFVFSTSAQFNDVHPKDNLYMWGRYANGHRGVAIEFNTMEIAQMLIKDDKVERLAPVTPNEIWVQVEYVPTFSSITRSMVFDFAKWLHNGEHGESKLHKYYNIIARIKSSDWKSENEWRLLWQREDTKRKVIRVPIGNKAVESVYIGMNTSPQVQEDIIFETRQNYPAATIFKVKKKRGGFALEFTLLT